MSGDNSNDRLILERREKRRELIATICGFIVVAGLIIEYGDEIVDCFVNKHWPSRQLFGGFLVTVGVLGEVLFARLALTTSRTLQERADSDVALANQRASDALKEAAEANLARAKIEQQMSARAISGEEWQGLKSLLEPHEGETVDVVVFDHHVFETVIFANQLFALFVSAGWRCRLWESRAATFRIPGSSALVAVAKGNEQKYMQLADSFARALRSSHIDCGVNLSSFGFDGGREFKPGDFALTSEHPRQFMGIRALSPFRIQVGAKQLAVLPPGKIAIVRPVKPPQT